MGNLIKHTRWKRPFGLFSTTLSSTDSDESGLCCPIPIPPSSDPEDSLDDGIEFHGCVQCEKSELIGLEVLTSSLACIHSSSKVCSSFWCLIVAYRMSSSVYPESSVLHASASNLIALLALAPHPEGGYYRVTYVSSVMVQSETDGPGHNRSAASHIYYLLPGGVVSKLHRLDADEIFHHYDGGPMYLVQLRSGDQPRVSVLGKDIRGGQVLQYTIPSNTWFGAYVDPDVEYSLVGCTLCPAFTFQGFELGSRDQLKVEFIEASEYIMKLT